MRNKDGNFEDIHELWYEWLKTTDKKHWTGATKADDKLVWSDRVRDWFGDCSMPFEVWRAEHLENFEDHKKERFCFQVIKDEDGYRRWSDKSDPEGEMVLFVNMRNPKLELMRAFRQLLKDRHPGSRGKPEHDDWREFPLAMRPEKRIIHVLNRMLDVYILRTNTNLTLWEIGEQLNLNPNKKSDEVPKRVLTAIVSRDMKCARTLRKNIVLGKFPVYK